MDLGLKGKRALVMGSSYGMGNGVARGLAAEGADIILTARTQDILDQEAKEIADRFGVRVEAIACDFSKEDEIDRLINFALGSFGGIEPFHKRGILGMEFCPAQVLSRCF